MQRELSAHRLHMGGWPPTHSAGGVALPMVNFTHQLQASQHSHHVTVEDQGPIPAACQVGSSELKQPAQKDTITRFPHPM